MISVFSDSKSKGRRHHMGRPHPTPLVDKVDGRGKVYSVDNPPPVVMNHVRCAYLRKIVERGNSLFCNECLEYLQEKDRWVLMIQF